MQTSHLDWSFLENANGNTSILCIKSDHRAVAKGSKGECGGTTSLSENLIRIINPDIISRFCFVTLKYSDNIYLRFSFFLI